jgi:hypothetical protein
VPKREGRSLAHPDVRLLVIGVAGLAVVIAVSYMTAGVHGLIIGPVLGLLVVGGSVIRRRSRAE